MNEQFYISQLVTILFTIYFARHNAPSANHFSNYGALPIVVAKFHSNGLKSRLCVVSGLSLMLLFPFSIESLKHSIAAGLINWSWCVLLFDPVLNKSRKIGLSWDYISKDNGTGRTLIKWFGDNAGEWKAVICVAGIIAVNTLIYFI